MIEHFSQPNPSKTKAGGCQCYRQAFASPQSMEEQVRATVNAMAIEQGKPTGRIDTKLIEQAIELLKTE